LAKQESEVKAMSSVKHRENAYFTRRNFLKVSGSIAGAFALDAWTSLPYSLARDQDVFPADAITFIVPHKPGGGFDTYVRAISPHFSKAVKEIVPGAKGGDIKIKNEPAASGRKAVSMLFRSKPDGYTIGSIDTASVTDNIVSEPDVDFSKFTFLQLATTTTRVILTSKKGYSNWNEVANAMKKKQVIMAAGSFGRANHTSAIILNDKMKTNFKLVPFAGTVETLNALMRGDVDTAITAEDSASGVISSGEVRVVLVFDDVNEYPGAVTAKELGFPELANQLSSHRYIIAPPGLGPEPKKILIDVIKKATANSDFMAWAKKSKSNVKNIYGDDAQRLFLQYIKALENNAPLIKKMLS
jgi:tripartite-type tricarboxylate transporter receptor subunit TctC